MQPLPKYVLRLYKFQLFEGLIVHRKYVNEINYSENIFSS